jgi:hypothetical protein
MNGIGNKVWNEKKGSNKNPNKFNLIKQIESKVYNLIM